MLGSKKLFDNFLDVRQHDISAGVPSMAWGRALLRILRPGRLRHAQAPPAEVPAHRPFLLTAAAGGIVRGLPARCGYPPATLGKGAPTAGS